VIERRYAKGEKALETFCETLREEEIEKKECLSTWKDQGEGIGEDVSVGEGGSAI